MSAKWKRKANRLLEVEKLIKLQEDSLVKAKENDIYTHGYLLQKLTDEWCELNNEIPDDVLMELFEAVA